MLISWRPKYTTQPIHVVDDDIGPHATVAFTIVFARDLELRGLLSLREITGFPTSASSAEYWATSAVLTHGLTRRRRLNSSHHRFTRTLICASIIFQDSIAEFHPGTRQWHSAGTFKPRRKRRRPDVAYVSAPGQKVNSISLFILFLNFCFISGSRPISRVVFIRVWGL